ncbi:hypothetical protein BJ741DRAFT_278533 [Chytriomyces cf. hyalinus JEL632]|nr:hypothetical protein BJ741DRAFT_278533 [Chytriomyces cf. hyalinus JEL632]
MFWFLHCLSHLIFFLLFLSVAKSSKNHNSSKKVTINAEPHGPPLISRCERLAAPWPPRSAHRTIQTARVCCGSPRSVGGPDSSPMLQKRVDPLDPATGVAQKEEGLKSPHQFKRFHQQNALTPEE